MSTCMHDRFCLIFVVRSDEENVFALELRTNKREFGRDCFLTQSRTDTA